jgi:hypothetical protein
MFDSRKEISERTLDAVDLVIDFATLGEYGLEPVDAAPRPCEARQRIGSPRRSTGTWSAAVNRFAVQP